MINQSESLPRSGLRSASIYVLVAAVLWGTTGTAKSYIPGDPDPMAVGAVRIAIGGLALTIAAWHTGSFAKGRTWPRLPMLLAAIGVAGYQVLFFSGIDRTGVAIGTVVSIGSAPAFAGLLAWIIRGERPARRWLQATAVSVFGATLLIAASSGAQGNVLGIALCLCAGLSYATYAIASKDLIIAGHSPETAMAVAFGGGAILLSPLLFERDVSWVASGRGIVIALHLGVITTAVAYYLFGLGLHRLPVSVAATLSLVEPLTASLLGILLLHESLTLLQVSGGVLILAGILILAVPTRAVPEPNEWQPPDGRTLQVQ